MFVHHGDHIVEGAGKLEEDVVDLPTDQREPVLVSKEALAIEPEDTSRAGLHVHSVNVFPSAHLKQLHSFCVP